MIKFFRHIRRALLGEGKFSKYLLYAIGEIFLVIIGILIALAISDWNSDRIEKKNEGQTLTQLKKGLLLDLDLIKAEQQQIDAAIVSTLRLQELLNDPKMMYSTGLDTLFGAVYGVRIVRINSAFYEDLKSSGLSLIRNENIRLQIVQLFENNYKAVAGLMNSEVSVNQVNRPYYLENFYDLDFTRSATPNDFNTVWTDSYYHNIVDYRLINLQSNQVNVYEKIVSAIEHLVSDIDNYIKQE